ncbi:hypothetical protein ABPG74_006719 [Tetrahymena malaccensis]
MGNCPRRQTKDQKYHSEEYLQSMNLFQNSGFLQVQLCFQNNLQEPTVPYLSQKIIQLEQQIEQFKGTQKQLEDELQELRNKTSQEIKKKEEEVLKKQMQLEQEKHMQLEQGKQIQKQNASNNKKQIKLIKEQIIAQSRPNLIISIDITVFEQFHIVKASLKIFYFKQINRGQQVFQAKVHILNQLNHKN